MLIKPGQSGRRVCCQGNGFTRTETLIVMCVRSVEQRLKEKLVLNGCEEEEEEESLQREVTMKEKELI